MMYSLNAQQKKHIFNHVKACLLRLGLEDRGMREDKTGVKESRFDEKIYRWVHESQFDPIVQDFCAKVGRLLR